MPSESRPDEFLIRTCRPSDEARVVSLWEKCGLTRPWNDPRKDIARKLGEQPQGFLVGLVDQAVVASVMAGYEGHRGWVNYLAVDPDFRRRGFGKAMMQAADSFLINKGCPKINLQMREENAEATAFYLGLGYRRDPVVSFGKRLLED